MQNIFSLTKTTEVKPKNLVFQTTKLICQKTTV